MLARPVVCRTLIGRRDELAYLEARRREASAAKGGLVVVAGEAGIGKTRLLSAFQASLQGIRVRVARAQCREFARGPYVPILDALREIDPAAATAEPGSSRDEHFDAIAGAFADAAEARGLVVLLEDMHWADASALELLAAIARRATTRRLLVVATYRSHDRYEHDPVLSRLTQLERVPGVGKIVLAPLSEPDVRALVVSALEDVGPLERRVLTEIVRLSDGNPLFAEELLKHAVERRARGPEATRALPTTIRAAVLERLQPLEEWECEALASAAVIGRRFSADLLETITGLPSARLLAALQRAKNLQLITEGDGDEFTFRHALTREAIYESLLGAQQRLQHRRIARALEALPTEKRSLDALAYHWWSARDESKAATYGERAGDAAMAVFAYEEAIRSYGYALDVLDGQAASVGRILLQRGFANGRIGMKAEAALNFEAAADSFRAHGDVVGECRALNGLVTARYNLAPADPLCLTPLREFRARLDTGLHPDVRAHVDVTLAQFHALRGEYPAANELLRSTAPTALGVGEALVKYHATCALLAANDADVDRFVHHVDAGIAAANGPGLVFHRSLLISNATSVLTDLGRFDAAERYFEMAKTPEGAARSVSHVFTLGTRARWSLFRGDLSTTRTLLLEALEAGAAIGSYRTARPSLALCGTYAGTLLGDDELAQRSFDEAPLAGGERVVAAAGLAEYLHAQGRDDEALALLREAIAEPVTPLVPFPLYLTLARLGSFEDAKRARDPVASVASLPGDVVYKATLRLFDALLAMRAGDRMAAVAHAVEAAPAFERIGCPLWQAEALALAGDVEAARVIYRAIGAIRRLRDVELRLSSAPGSKPVRGSGGLSQRERDVANLVAQGLPNKEIANRLSVTSKSVEKHLSSIYQKLGFSSRGKLVAYMAEHRYSRP